MIGYDDRYDEKMHGNIFGIYEKLSTLRETTGVAQFDVRPCWEKP